MRLLGIETSSRRGSVALIENGRLVCSTVHREPNRHGELLAPMVGEIFASAGWSAGSIDRLAVGVGPGSFTGIRVGIAFAHGVALGLDRLLFGIGSLLAMSGGVPADRAGTRIPVIDARRGEVFLAAYDPRGREISPPAVVPVAEASQWAGRLAAPPRVWVGERVDGLSVQDPMYSSDETDLPHAVWTARVASRLPESDASADPLYIRPVDVTVPKLPPSPLS